MSLSLRGDTIKGLTNICWFLRFYKPKWKTFKKNWLNNICFLILPSLGLTMATTSGKLKANCSAVNAALPNANTRQWPWHRCRRTAPRRTSSSPARHLTPALPTVHPVLPKTLLTLNSLHVHMTDGHTGTPVCIPLELLSVNLYLISTSDWSHRPSSFIKCHTDAQ